MRLGAFQRNIARTAALGVALAGGGAAAALADEINVYSSRHYDTDLALYAAYTEATGVEINVIEGKADELIARMVAEGRNSPADVLITADAGRLHRAVVEGVLQAMRSDLLEQAIPAHLRDPDGYWFGLSKRVRMIFYARDAGVDPARVATYEALADPDLGHGVCIRSSNNIYNQSLLASIIAALGEDGAEAWAAGVVANMGRDPEGADRAQLDGAASGECDIAVANSYYFVRYMRSDDAQIQAVVGALVPVFPNQNGRGAHINVSGAGVAANAPNPAAALAFIEYLAGPQGQAGFAAANNEFPVAAGTEIDATGRRFLDLAGASDGFVEDTLDLSLLGEYNAAAVRIFDRVGWR